MKEKYSTKASCLKIKAAIVMLLVINTLQRIAVKISPYAYVMAS